MPTRAIHPPMTCRIDTARPLSGVAWAALACLWAASLLSPPAQAQGLRAEPAVATRQAPAEHPGLALLAQVQRQVGRAACDSDTQCRTLPLGARACGGPESFVAWSVRGTDAAALHRAAEQYGRWQSQQQARQGVMSICAVETDPGAVCARPSAAAVKAGEPAGRCVLGSPATPGQVAR